MTLGAAAGAGVCNRRAAASDKRRLWLRTRCWRGVRGRQGRGCGLARGGRSGMGDGFSYCARVVVVFVFDDCCFDNGEGWF